MVILIAPIIADSENHGKDERDVQLFFKSPLLGRDQAA
jgi:hypothetical protein